jgi:hypothetical protein
MDNPIIDEYGTKRWFTNDRLIRRLHRTDGPAIEYADGGKQWFLNDKLHRADGPAIERHNGDKFWHFGDQLHRTDGPACEYADGRKKWYLNDDQHKFDQWLEENTELTDGEKVMMKLQYG